MRDSFIALLFIAGIAGSYAYMKNSGYLKSSLSVHEAARVSSKAKQPLGSAKKGVKQDETTDRNHHQQDPEHGENEGATGDLAEAQGLPSIYEGQGQSESGQLEPAVEPSKSSGLTDSSKRKKAARASRSAIPGVPVQAFIQYKKGALPLGAVPYDEGDGLRVFVQCMELKNKGPEYLGSRECEKLLATKPTPKVNAY